MRKLYILGCLLLLAGCGQSGSGNHQTRTVGKTGALVKVIHFSAPW